MRHDLRKVGEYAGLFDIYRVSGPIIREAYYVRKHDPDGELQVETFGGLDRNRFPSYAQALAFAEQLRIGAVETAKRQNKVKAGHADSSRDHHA